MPYVVQYDVPGDERVYAQVKTAIGNQDPAGLRVHLVVRSPTGGLRHIEVWDNALDQERFERERVAPAVAEVLRSMGVDPVPSLPPRDPLDLVDLHVVR
jgi:hypothetical protein